MSNWGLPDDIMCLERINLIYSTLYILPCCLNMCILRMLDRKSSIHHFLFIGNKYFNYAVNLKIATLS
ncbi:hypothetical protein LZ31DRAFT_559506 [Colletotrichum somersetense]|nr:hypothetical protein LZ31DRAFT_559506 [Colletotrichum somersetense]